MIAVPTTSPLSVRVSSLGRCGAGSPRGGPHLPDAGQRRCLVWCWPLEAPFSAAAVTGRGTAWWALDKVVLWGGPGRSGPEHSHKQMQKLSLTLHLPGFLTPHPS